MRSGYGRISHEAWRATVEVSNMQGKASCTLTTLKGDLGMSNRNDPAFWEEERHKALEAANLPGATEDDRKRALETVKDAEEQLHRIMRQSAPRPDDLPEQDAAPDKKPLPIQD
jgi:hypothetical protein